MLKIKIALAMVSLVVGVLLCEFALRLLYPQVFRRPDVWHYDPDLGWSHIPGAVGRLISPEFDVEMKINGVGLRDREFVVAKKADTRRIAIFGDSFVEGWGVSIENVVSRRLESCLQQGGGDVEVANFGVAGYGTDQALLFFEQRGVDFGAEEVVLFFYGNDLWNNGSRKGIGAERGFKPYFKVRNNGQLTLAGVPVKKANYWNQAQREWPVSIQADLYFSRHWHLYKLVKKALRPEVPLRQQQTFYEGLYGRNEAKRFASLWALTGRILKLFKERVEARGAQLTIVYVPSIVQVEEDNWLAKRQLHGLAGDFDLRKPNIRLADFAERYDLHLIDLLDEFKERAQTETLYLRDSHWNAAGHALAADRLCANLGPRGIAP